MKFIWGGENNCRPFYLLRDSNPDIGIHKKKFRVVQSPIELTIFISVF